LQNKKVDVFWDTVYIVLLVSQNVTVNGAGHITLECSQYCNWLAGWEM